MLTEIVFILDRSGSMSGLEADTIGGFNSTARAPLPKRVRFLKVSCCHFSPNPAE